MGKRGPSDTQTIAGLTWYHDLGLAQRAAARDGRPILSLRMLGRLDQELSCANSRFFRTLLYPEPRVAALLGGFVLHWHTVRPVPVITIDFGDGRRLQRTVTGNSAHFVLDAEGRPVDALPGLFSADDFLELARAAHALAVQTRRLPAAALAAHLARWHSVRLADLLGRWRSELIAIGRAPAEVTTAALEAATDAGCWAALAARRLGLAAANPTLQSALERQPPSAREAGELAMTKRMVERPLLDALLPLAATVSEDSVRNAYGLHRRVHEHFASGHGDRDVAELQAWVYRELFLMPEDDAWLGLKPPHAFAAIDDLV